jgi:phenylacetate-CoA ligase
MLAPTGKLAGIVPRKEDLEPIETASRDAISALQLQRLQWSLKHAYENVQHYRKSFDAAGVHPDDLKTLTDLAKFPFTTKNDLRANYPFGMFAVPREKIGSMLLPARPASRPLSATRWATSICGPT